MATTLTAGDIAIVGIGSEGPPGVNYDANADSFAFVVLRDIDAGTQLNFTDNIWRSANNAFDTNDRTYTYTFAGAVTAGTVVTVAFDGANPAFLNFPSSFGDQIFAYQGTLGSPTLVAGFQSTGDWGLGGPSPQFPRSSDLPSALTDGGTAVSVGVLDSSSTGITNWAYTGPLTGTKAALLAAINNENNWTGGDDFTDISFPGNFTISAQATPAEIELRGNAVPIADGDTTPSYADHTQFGQTATSGGTIDRVFTIINQGGTDLHINGTISITGANAGDFSILAPPSGTVAPGASTTFTVRFDPSAGGLRQASISIPNDDSNENPYDFNVSGSGVAAAPTSLAAGDIAIVGYNGTAGNTQFAFVLLKPIVAGTVINFTDAGWSGSALNPAESMMRWVAPTDLAFGTVVQFDESNIGPNFQRNVDAYFSGTSVHLESNGDQIFAYTGSGGSPTFLGGIHTDNTVFDSTYTPGSSSQSLVPPGLVDGQTTISFANGATPFASGVYSGSTTGDRTALLAKINNEANWTGSAATQTLPSGTFGGGSSAPEIDVQYQVGAVAIADGDTTPIQTDGTQFDPIDVSAGSQTHTFVIRNLGDTTLNLGTVTITGANANDFSFVLGATTLTASQSTTLTVTFNPSAAGARTATVTIPSNDADEASYDFAIRGLGRDPTQTLAAGDVAFAGYDAANNRFAFVLLEDVAAGTSIKFTDGGWTGTTYRQAEGATEWVAPSALEAGTVVTYDAALPNGGVDFTPADTGYFTGISFDPDVAGDQIIAYQGTASAGGAGLVNLAALYYDKTSFDGAYTNTIGSSLLPTGLVDGQTAISFGKPDNVSAYTYGRYNGPTNLPFPQQLAALNNEANWTGNDSGVTFPSGPIGVDPNTPPTLGANAGLTLNEGATGTITAARLDFNDAEQADTAITYTVTTAATNGTLFRSGVALNLGGTFTQADINANLITYAHNGGETTSASFGFSVSDGAGGSVTGQSFAFTVTPVNDAPTLTGANALPNTTTSTPSSGTPVSAILAGRYSDPDPGALSGIAITGTVGNGTWQYSTDGSTWTNVGAVAGTAALLLSSATQVRYQPDGASAETPTLTFRGWDQTSGTASANGAPQTADTSSNGGATAFSPSTAQTQLTVSTEIQVPSRLFFTTQAGAPDTYLTYSNPDGTGITQQVLDTTPGSPWQETVIDAAENRYYILQYDTGFNNGIIYTGQLNSNAAPTVAFTFQPEDLVAGLEIDTVNNKIYVSRLDVDSNFDVQNATTGILAIDYNPATGALSNTNNFIVTQQSNPLPPGPGVPQGFILATDLARDDTDGTLYFARATAGAQTNMIYRVDASNNISPLLNQAQFPVDFSNGLIVDVEVDASRNLVYFSTYSQPFQGAGSDQNDFRIWVISDTATGSTNATAVTIVGASANFRPGDMTIDPLTHQLYVESEETVTQASGTGTDDLIYRFQLSADGLTATVINTIDPTITTDNGNIGGLEFVPNVAPTLDLDANNSAGIGGSGYQATFTENGAAVAIADTDVTITDDDANVVSATITLTNRQAGDSLAVSGALPAGISASAYNAGTGVLTLSGSASKANYQAAIRQVQFSNSSDTPSTTDRAITVTVNDGTSSSTAATATIHVTAVNDPPTVNLNTGLTLNEGASATITSARLDFNDPEQADTAITYTVTTPVTNGTLFRNGVALGLNSVFTQADINANLITYTHNGGETTSASFGFSVSDGAGGTVAGQSFAFTVTPVNDAPALTNTVVSLGAVGEDAGAPSGAVGTLVASLVDLTPPAGGQDNVVDPDAAGLTGIAVVGADTTNGSWYYSIDGGASWLALGDPAGGSAARLLAADANTRVYFQPNADFNGTITSGLTFRAWDRTTGTNGGVADTLAANGGTTAFSTATDTAAITVNAVADIAADSATLVEDSGPTEIDVLANDSFEAAGSFISALGAAAHGTVSIDTRGDADPTNDVVVYTPDTDYWGPDSFTYTVRSGGVDETATVTLNVTAVADIAADSATVAEDSGTTTLDLLANDTFEGAGRSISAVGPAANGTVVIDTLGDADPTNDVVTYTPNADFHGMDTFSYTVTSGGATETATVTVTVTPDPDIANDTAATSEDVPVAIPVLANDSFEGTPAITSVTNGAFGSVTVNDNGTPGNTADDYLVYTPNPNRSGSDSFTYTVTSGGATETATVTVNVAAAPDDPVFVDLGGPATYTEDGGRVLLDTNASLVDADITDGTQTGLYAGATLSVSRQGGANPDDVIGGSGTLSFSDGQVLLTESDPLLGSVDIPVGSYLADGGALAITFNADASGDRINAVLRQLSYANGNQDPSGQITLDYVFDNGTEGPALGSVLVNLVATDDRPVLDGVAPAPVFRSGTPVLLSEFATVSDPDDATLLRATIQITNGFSAGDVLTFTVPAGSPITGGYAPGTGILTLTGPATLAEFEAVLRTVAFDTASVDPTSGGAQPTRDITFLLDDASGSPQSDVQTATVYFAPRIDLDGSAAGLGFATTYTENGAGIAIGDTDLTVSAGTYGVQSARIELAGAQAGDALTISGALPPGFSTTTDTSTPGLIVLTISGFSSTGSEFQTALGQVRFSSINDDPSASRQIAVALSDGNATSEVAVTTLSITAVNDGPVLTGFDPLTVGENAANAAPVVVDADVTFTDPDLHGGTITVSGLLAEDRLSLQEDGTVTLSGTTVSVGGVAVGTVAGGVGATFTITLNGSATSADVDTLLEHLAYQTVSDVPTPSRTLSVVVTDELGASTAPSSIVVSVTPENDRPTLDLGAARGSATEQVAARLAPNASVSDPELDSLNGGLGDYAGAFFYVTRGSSDDAFGFDAGASFTVQATGPDTGELLSGGLVFATYDHSGGTGSVRFTSSQTTATSALADEVLARLTYTNLSDAPPASVTFGFVFDDGQAAGGSGDADQRFYPVDIAPVNDAPVLTGPQAALAAGTEDTPYLVAAADLLQGWSDPEGSPLGVSGLSADRGTVADNGNGTFTITPDANYFGPVVLSYAVTDGSLSTAASRGFALGAVNDPPVLAGDAAIAMLQGGVAAVTTADLTSSDVDPGATATYTVTATERGSVLRGGVAVSSFTQTELAGGQISFRQDGTRDPAASFTVIVSDGTASAGPRTINAAVDVVPVVSGIAYGSNDGTLRAGETVTLAVALSEAVTVTGNPTLSLNSGGTATFVAGASSATSLVFSYTVGAVDNAADLAVTSLNLAGAVIQDAAGQVLAALPPGGINPAGILAVDTIADSPPTVSLAVDGTGNGVVDLYEARAIRAIVTGLDADARAVATFTDGVRTVTAAVAADGELSVDLSSLDGNVTSTLQTRDAAGNTFAVAGNPILIDVDAFRDLFGTVVSDASGPAGQIYELYAGLLGRAPDSTGYQFFLEALQGGATLTSIAAQILSSPEYVARNGPISAETDQSFIDELYHLVLGRDPEPGGIAFWLGELAGGASREDVALRFAVSQENVAQDAGALGAGVFAPSSASDVARLYYTILDRAPDAAGLAGFTGSIRAGGSELDVARAMLASDEYAARFGAPDDLTFIDALYDGALGRDPEPAGLADFQAALASGQSRAQIAVTIADSLEANVFHYNDIENGWHVI